jgi:16S rRNA (guanine527-N7)-methyltransferase
MESPETKLEVILRYFSGFSDKQLRQLGMLWELYSDWNAKINVISRKDIDKLYERHVLHSLSIAAWMEFAPGMEVIDIGTGGGFPGIPLAIFFPEVRFHLVDSVGKKLKVVEAVVEATGLRNITVQHTRAESIRGRSFDFAVSRAVAPLKDLWAWSLPLLRNDRKMADFKNGLVCLKGGDLSQEISESRLRPHVKEIHSLFPEPAFEGKYLVYVPV